MIACHCDLNCYMPKHYLTAAKNIYIHYIGHPSPLKIAVNRNTVASAQTRHLTKKSIGFILPFFHCVYVCSRIDVVSSVAMHVSMCPAQAHSDTSDRESMGDPG